MRRRSKLFIVSATCALVAIGLLVTTVAVAHLMANRDMVKTFIVDKTARATGGELDYDRLVIGWFPLPHLEVQSVQLIRPDTLDIRASNFSVYPKLLPILKGEVRIRRVDIVAPDIRTRVGRTSEQAPPPSDDTIDEPVGDAIKKALAGLFGAMAVVDPGTELTITQGGVTLMSDDVPDLHITGIDAHVENDDGSVTLSMDCRSELTGRLELKIDAQMERSQAKGQLKIAGINLRPLLVAAPLPGGITIEDTRAILDVDFSVDGPDAINSRFSLRFPRLNLDRQARQLVLNAVVIDGTADYADNSLSISLETLQARQPALNLSAAANIRPARDGNRSTIDLHAAADHLDIAVARAAILAIAGDLDSIQTVFSYAKSGQLSDVTYAAGFEIRDAGWHLTGMKASGHLTHGRVGLAVIEADLTQMTGDIVYADQRVAFSDVSGTFQGASFKQLEAAIDWEKEAILSIASPSVTVDMDPLHTWLTGFEALSGSKKIVEAVSGRTVLSVLEINGPLTRPQDWTFTIAGTPVNLRLKSPLVPFEIGLSGGKVEYQPGVERLTDVTVEFLDGAFVASYLSEGVVEPESIACHIDGTMGQATIDWLGTLLPIPDHLQMKPPLVLSDVSIAWDRTNTFSFEGGLKTDGGVALSTDFIRTPEVWDVRNLQFNDGRSNATVAFRMEASALTLAFSGNVEKQTADKLLRDNQTLSGRVEGDFRLAIDRRAILDTSFDGRLSGEGLHLHRLLAEPIEIDRFAVSGSGNGVTIDSSEMALCNSRLVVDGRLKRADGQLTVDLNVAADRIDEKLIETLTASGKPNAEPDRQSAVEATTTPRGVLQVTADDVSYAGFNWSGVDAGVRIDSERTTVAVRQADLCGISTPGTLQVSPQGVSLDIAPAAAAASLEETLGCLWQRQIEADVRYDLSGRITLPATRQDPLRHLAGQLELSSQNGSIQYASTLMKIFSVLNVTEVFTGGKSDLAEKGYGYTQASTTIEFNQGKLKFNEILLDGNSLKITGQGSIDLTDRTVDVILLAAPLKTVDRIVNKIPIISYITGGTLISVPLRVTGKVSDPSVVPMSPTAVGKGVLNIMGRILKAPYKLVEASADVPPIDTTHKGP